VGRGIVLRRKMYVVFGARTQGMFPQRTGFGFGEISAVHFRVILGLVILCLESVLVSLTSDVFFILRCFFLFLSQSMVFKPLRGR